MPSNKKLTKVSKKTHKSENKVETKENEQQEHDVVDVVTVVDDVVKTKETKKSKPTPMKDAAEAMLEAATPSFQKKTEPVPELETPDACFERIAKQLNEWANDNKEIAKLLNLRAVELKKAARDIKSASKRKRLQSKRRTLTQPDKNRPVPFETPVKVSDELAKLLELDPENVTRRGVNSSMNIYIKKHNLQDPKNKRVIMVHKDEALRKLLNAQPDEEITYFNIQTKLKNLKHMLG